MVRLGYITAGLVLSVLWCSGAWASERFPPPQFETEYQQPTTTIPNLPQDIWEYVDSGVLLAAIGLSSYLVLRRRSRKAIFTLVVFSLAYFGFWRKGCVCAIGSIQNVVLSIFDPEYAIPAAVLVFFLAPLISTLFFGRTFCAAVCPLGAVQDLVVLRPVAVPVWLESGLRLFAYVYLGLAVLLAATGSAFVICRYDPFVSFFRVTGNANILVLGVCFLVVGIFVARPYCRFVCPYGVILRQLSRLSRWRVTITPDECVKCRLCEDSCPFGAIRKPTADWPAGEYKIAKRRLAGLLLLLPVLVFLGAWLGHAVGPAMSRTNPTVALAERMYSEEQGKVEDTTDASTAFRATGKTVAQLYEEASDIRARFGKGSLLFGAFVGLVGGLKLAGASVRRKRTGYEADRASCLACGRCFEYCPREHLRLKDPGKVVNKE